jgi:periplasmic copper chaperone A
MNLMLWLVATMLMALATAAGASDYELGPLKIDHPWSRATPKGAKIAAGYLTVTNTGSRVDRLLGATLADAERAQVHQMTTDNGVMKMRPLSGGLEIKPGETIELRPNSFHLMFTGLRAPLIKGQSVRGSLTFEHAGILEVEFAVEGTGAPSAQKVDQIQIDKAH